MREKRHREGARNEHNSDRMRNDEDGKRREYINEKLQITVSVNVQKR